MDKDESNYDLIVKLSAKKANGVTIEVQTLR